MHGYFLMTGIFGVQIGMWTLHCRVCSLHHTADTIDQGTKYQFSGASATPERKVLSTQGPTTTPLHQYEQQCDQQLRCFSPHRGPQHHTAVCDFTALCTCAHSLICLHIFPRKPAWVTIAFGYAISLVNIDVQLVLV